MVKPVRDASQRERDRIRQAKHRQRLTIEKKDEINRTRRERRKKGKERQPDKKDRTVKILNLILFLRRLSSGDRDMKRLLERYKWIHCKRWSERKEQLEYAIRESRRRAVSQMVWKARVRKLQMQTWNYMSKLKSSLGWRTMQEDLQLYTMSFSLLPNLSKSERLITAQNTGDVAREVVRVSIEEIGKIVQGMKKQVTKGVAHPPAVQHMDPNVRIVGRMRYHNCKAHDPESVPLCRIYRALYREFMGLEETEEDDDVIVEAVMDDLLHRVELLDMRTEPDDEIGNGIMEVPAEDREDQELLNRAGRDIMNEDPLMREFGSTIAPSMIGRVTRVRKCDFDCTDMTSREAEMIQREVTNLASMEVKDLSMDVFDAFSKKVQPVIAKRSSCYAGIRSFGTRVRELRICLETLKHSKRLLDGCSDVIWAKILGKDWLWLPQRLRKTVEPLFSTNEERMHSEAAVRRQYGKSIDKFESKIGDLEMEVCDVCARFSKSAKLIVYKETPKLNVTDELRSPFQPGTTRVCNKCRQEAYKNGRERKEGPLKFSPKNDVKFEEVPSCLTDLNWVEKAMIQLNRPIRAVGCLKNVLGQPTQMRCTGGGMVILPVPTEGTIDHVVETLPSDVNISIIVHAATVGHTRLVCLPRVLEALEWLKANNHHYQNITINPDFHFNAETVIVADAEDENNPLLSQAELDELVTDDPNHRSLLAHIGTTTEVVRANNPGRRSTTAFEEYNLLKNTAKPISNQEKFIDERAFPWLFPSGRFGYNAVRKKKLTPRLFIRWALTTEDRRIAVDANALAFYHGIFEQTDIRSALGMQARMSRTELETETFEAAEAAAQFEFQLKLQTVTRKLRGTMKYWEGVANDVRAHIAILGTPTWFITLNPAEKNWEHVITIYQKIYGVNEVTSANIFEWICQDPFFFARYFNQRVRSFFKEVIVKDNGPLGTVIHYFYRLEYQSRGTPHVHCLIWSKDAPKDEASDEEKLAYLSKHVTARLPDKDKEPRLFAAVDTFQRHWSSHSQTCLRSYKIQGKVMKKCRFGFPRPVTPVAILNERANELAGVPGASGKTYFLPRTKDEEFINDYSPALLLGWDGNTDTQYVFGGYQQAISYITGYAVKSEKPKEGSEVQKALKGATNNTQGMKALLSLTAMRECGKLELVETMLGHNLFQFDSDHVPVNTNHTDSRVRILKTAQQMIKLGPKKYLENVYDDFYGNRPEQLEPYCLLTILMYFRVESPRKNKQNDDDHEEEEEDEDGNTPTVSGNIFTNLYHPECKYSPFYAIPSLPTGTRLFIDNTEVAKQFVKAGKPRVPSFFWPNLERCNEESREDYFRRLCMAFIPWRDEDELKTDARTGTEYEMYEERWLAFVASLEESDDEEKKIGLEDIKRVIKHHEALIEQDRIVRERRREIHQAELAERVGGDEEEGAIEVHARDVDVEKHDENKANMNGEQLALFDSTINSIERQDDYDEKVREISNDDSLNPTEKKEQKELLGERPRQLLSLVLGNAGCGKSFVINTIADELTLRYTTPSNRGHQPAIVLAAPTGLAAVQISGATLHSLLKIEVQHGRDSAIKPMSEKNQNSTRIQFRNVRLLIIDEMSMVSNIVLAKVHFRLQEIKGNEDLFGGVNVMMLGDLMQLPPVQAPPIFKPLDAGQLNRIFNSVLSSLNLFSFFKFTELVQNMRQRGDTAFAEILQRMRVQQMTDDDFEALESRKIPDIDNADSPVQFAARYYVDLQKTDPTVLALFGTNSEVAEFNESVINELGLEVTVVECEDTQVEGSRRGRRGTREVTERPYQRSEFDLSKMPREDGGMSARAKKNLYNRAKFDANKAGGLAETVILAEGGRIMLRRNIDAPKGLVNGVTGVLKKIHKTSSGIPVKLEIEFDGTLGTHDIQKVSAIFNVTNDIQISRRQFPVVMSFGATVHKCQGLTLANAILSTANFFSGGQAFVAFSRVKTLAGIHLIDFHKDNIYCCQSSREVYNGLRASIGLPEYGEMTERAAKTARRSSIVTPKGKSVTTPASSRRRASVDRPTTAEVGAPKKRRSSIMDTPQAANDGDTLAMRNYTNTDCFMISTVNMIHSMPPVAAAVLQEAAAIAQGNSSNPVHDTVIGALADLLEGKTDDVILLRQAVGMTLDNGGCSMEATMLLSQCLPDVATAHISQQQRGAITCRNGHRQNMDVADFPSQLYLEIHSHKLPDETTVGSLEDLYEGTLLGLHQTCTVPGCGMRNEQVDLQLTMNGKYIFVFVNIHGMRETSPPKIPPEFERFTRQIDISEKSGYFKFFGNRVRVVAAIEHITGTGGDGGHFMLWKKADTNFTVINDHVTISGKRCPKMMRGFNVIVLERR